MPISLFEEIEQELSLKLFNNKNEGNSIDGPIDFIENLVNILQVEFDGILSENDDKKLLIRSLTKIFAILLSVKANSAKKIKQIVKLAINIILKIWSGRNQLQKGSPVSQRI